MGDDDFAAWLAAREFAVAGKGGGFDDADAAQRVLSSQLIISVSLDDLDGTDGDLLS